MSATPPLVTIAIAAFNGQSTIEKCLESALKQTYVNTEILISNDCSTDMTGEVCLRLRANNRNIRYFENRKTIGIHNNYNFLLSQARGQYFILFDQDDSRDSDFIEKCVDRIRDTQVEIVFGQVVVYFNDQVMHINNYNKTSVSGSVLKRIFYLLRRPSDFLLYGLLRTNSLRELGGWKLSTSAFYRIIFSLCLRGEIATIDSKFLYTAKGAIGRPSKNEELRRNGVGAKKSNFMLPNPFETLIAYVAEIIQGPSNNLQKIILIFLVIHDAIYKGFFKLFFRITYKYTNFQFKGNIENFLIYLYQPIDHIKFIIDRKDNRLGYYRANWPLI